MSNSFDTPSAAGGAPVDIEQLDTPAVLVDLDRLNDNLLQTQQICSQRGVRLRPHAKAHKSKHLLNRQLVAGAMGVTVAKLDEAEALSSTPGLMDVFVAYPIVSAVKAKRAMHLEDELTVSLTIDSLTGAAAIADAARERGKRAKVLIEIDSGLARCGIVPDDVDAFCSQVLKMSGIEVIGVFTHAGQSYGAKSWREVREIAREEVRCVTRSAAKASRAGADISVMSVGSTPTVLANVDELEQVSEIRPGNYVFKDRMQVGLGGATLAECSLSVLCTVVSTASGNAVVDAGSKTFGQDRGAHGNLGLEGFGVNREGDLRIDRLSEEHGVIAKGAARVKVGDRLRITPNHACVVADLASVLYGVKDERIVEMFTVDVRGGGR